MNSDNITPENGSISAESVVEGSPEKKAGINRDTRADHLRPFCFKPGQSGNPAGRPKRVASELERRATKRALRRVADALLRKAGDNDAGECSVEAFTALRDTLDGPPERKDRNSSAVDIEIVIGGSR
jgi:hypothetical protein